MRVVEFTMWNAAKSATVTVQGYFHGWGIGIDQNDMPVTMGIIEDDDGDVHIVHTDCFKFARSYKQQMPTECMGT